VVGSGAELVGVCHALFHLVLIAGTERGLHEGVNGHESWTAMRQVERELS
jgi:hypothetical protein